MLLQKGDEAYQAGRYQEAVEAYAGARDQIPDAPVSSALRKAATDRYAQASVELGRQLSRKGDVAGARTAVDKVLADGVAPNDPGALAFRAQLDDPIRTNPALTAEHAKNVDEVRRLLYTADGAYQLGKFDEADLNYQEVLRIDATNTAARRGMERVAAARSGYRNAASDHARAEMLAQVDAAWETAVPAPQLDPSLGDPGIPGGIGGEITVAARLDQIIVPKIALDQTTLSEAVDYLRTLKGEDGQTVNFNLNLGPTDSEAAQNIRSRKFNLQLNQVPLSRVLKYITELTQTSFTTDEFSVVISPAGSTSDELVSRNYRVPPDFITSISTGAAADQGNQDPFAETNSREGLLTTRLSAEEALKKQGIAFPEGATAAYSAATSTLRIVNTAANHEMIAQMVEAASQTEPAVVAVHVTMLKVEQTILEELGFDWLVNPFGLSANHMWASGGTPGNTPGRTASDFVSPVGGTSIDGVPADPTSLVSNLVTNGLRSGSQGIQSNNLDGLIASQDRSQQATVAPGIMAVTGLFSDGQVQMLMRGLDQKKSTDMMQMPAVMTRSGQQATVEVVREFIYATEYEPPELPNSVGETGSGGSFPVTPATPTAFEMEKVGTVLEVLPVADADRRFVNVTLNPSFSDFDGYVNYGSPINTTVQSLLGGTEVATVTDNSILMPIFSYKRANTQVTVADGSTIVLGGLMAESVQNVEDKVPVFGDIPVVGRLFSTKAKKPVSSAIIFLVKVDLLDPTGRPYRDR